MCYCAFTQGNLQRTCIKYEIKNCYFSQFGHWQNIPQEKLLCKDCYLTAAYLAMLFTIFAKFSIYFKQVVLQIKKAD